MIDYDGILRKHFPSIACFQDIQKPVIENVLAGNSTLCLMPTGGGKSLIYQVAGCAIGKTTLVISPLLALIDQQIYNLNKAGFRAEGLHLIGNSPKKYYKTISQLFIGKPVDFLFVSPERLTSDGYLEHVLWKYHESIGLIVIDEAHCVSQWGHAFRTTYKLLPREINYIFGKNIPVVLCLTATLNPKDQEEIKNDFNINDSNVFRSVQLRREDLQIKINSYEHEEGKKQALESILLASKNIKTIVYVHRKKGQYGTREMAEKFRSLGLACSYFDADASDEHKKEVMENIISGEITIVFATSAFGMGIDIPDIRRVIHYLLPESVEQYYQEIGRAGRDKGGAECLLMFTQTNIRIRKDMILGSIPTKKEILITYERRQNTQGRPISSLNMWEDLSDELNEKASWYYLLDHDVIKIVAKGFRRISIFDEKSESPVEFKVYMKATKLGLAITVADRMGISLNDLQQKLFSWIEKGQIGITRSPEKALFYKQEKDLDEQLINEINDNLEEKRCYRLQQFDTLVNAINDPSEFENHIFEQLEI